MAKSEDIFFKGKASWFRVIQGDPEYKVWSVKLHFDQDSYSKFMQLKEDDGDVAGIMNEVKKDDDGYFHVFKRQFFKDFGKGPEPLQPPLVLDANNQPWDPKVMVGNGSDITVKCELYRYKARMSKKQGRAIRLAAVRIDNLVPYSTDSYTDDQKKVIKGMDQVETEHAPF